MIFSKLNLIMSGSKLFHVGRHVSLYLWSASVQFFFRSIFPHAIILLAFWTKHCVQHTSSDRTLNYHCSVQDQNARVNQLDDSTRICGSAAHKRHISQNLFSCIELNISWRADSHIRRSLMCKDKIVLLLGRVSWPGTDSTREERYRLIMAFWMFLVNVT